MLLLTGEAPPCLQRVPNVLDVTMEPGTEFGETPLENLLSVASVLLRDLEQAGFSEREIRTIAKHLSGFTRTMTGGEN